MKAIREDVRSGYVTLYMECDFTITSHYMQQLMTMYKAGPSGMDKIAVIKSLRTTYNLSLKAAKELGEHIIDSFAFDKVQETFIPLSEDDHMYSREDDELYVKKWIRP